MSEFTKLNQTNVYLGKIVSVLGFISTVTKHENFLLLLLKDTTGWAIIKINKQAKSLFQQSLSLKEKWCVQVTGLVKTTDPALNAPPSVQVEIEAQSIGVILSDEADYIDPNPNLRL